MHFCKIGIHHWGRWGKFIQGYDKLTQFRECKSCGIRSYRGIYGEQVPIDLANKSIEEVIND